MSIHMLVSSAHIHSLWLDLLYGYPSRPHCSCCLPVCLSILSSSNLKTKGIEKPKLLLTFLSVRLNGCHRSDSVELRSAVYSYVDGCIMCQHWVYECFKCYSLFICLMRYAAIFHVYVWCMSRLLNFDADKWVHLNCALWSNEVYETMNGALMYVDSAFKRGASIECTICHKPGATAGCFRPRCLNVYHIACAQQDNVTFFEDKVILSWLNLKCLLLLLM